MDKFVCAAALCFKAVTVTADTGTASDMPPDGKMICEINYRHNIPMEVDSREFVMVTSGSCSVVGAPEYLVHQYTMSLAFDERGVGTLLNGLGFNLSDGKPVSALTMDEATYTLEFSDGKVIGWTAEGALSWDVGAYVGQQSRWTAYPTGPDSLVIDYQLDR